MEDIIKSGVFALSLLVCLIAAVQFELIEVKDKADVQSNTEVIEGNSSQHIQDEKNISYYTKV